MSRSLEYATWFLPLSVSILLLKFRVTAVTKTIQTTKLERETALDDYTCISKDLLISESVRDLSMCAFMCMEDDTCQTMFYNQQEGKCNGCTARYTPASAPLTSPGFIHFQKAQKFCDSGWTSFKGSCYSLSPQGFFSDGVQYCETNGAHPVYIETSEENEFLKTYLTHDTSHVFWYMGMTDSLQNGVWRYYGTNESVSYLDFYHSEPNDIGINDQQCAMFVSAFGFNYQWADHYCNDILSTICEKTL